MEALQTYIELKDLNIKPFLNPSEFMPRANDLLTNTFSFNKTWDMERCIKKYQLIDLDFYSYRNNDEEWTFMLNRFDYLGDLVQAYIYTSDTAYSDKVIELMLTWINTVSLAEASHANRTLDTGMRCINFLDAITYLHAYKQIDQNTYQYILNSINLQISYMYNNYLNKYTLSNWGTIQICAILYCLMQIDKDYTNNKYFIWALNELDKQLAIQVYSDGMFWEQSSMYHVEVLNYGLRILAQAKVINYTFDKSVINKFKALTTSIQSISTPKNYLEAYGDSDEVYLGDVLFRATIIFNDSTYKNKLEPIDSKSLYELGVQLIKQYADIPITDNLNLIYDGIDSGINVIKTSNQEDASMLFFINSSLGSGHGHADNLHFSIYYKGLPILSDMGRYTYVENNPQRIHFKSMYAHNTIVIDDKPIAIPNGSWTNQAFCNLAKTYVRHFENIHYLEAMIFDEATNQIIIRKLTMISDDIFIINDLINYQGTHTLSQYFNLHPNANYDDHIINNQNASLKLVSEGELLVKGSICSLRYNEISDTKKIVINNTFNNCFANFNCLINPNYHVTKYPVYQDTKLASEDLVKAIKIQINTDDYYLVVIFNKQVYDGKKIFYVDGIPLHSKSIVISFIDSIYNTYICKT